MVLDLEEVVLRPEQLPVHRRGRERRRVAVLEEVAPDLALRARRQRQQPLRVAAQQLVVDARLVVEPLQERERRQAHQVPEPDLVARQQHQVVSRIARLVLAPAPRDVGLHAHQRLDARLARLLIELDRAEQRAVVGERERRHRQLGRAFHHARDRARTVEQRVVAVVVEVHEVGVVHGASCAEGDRKRPQSVSVSSPKSLTHRAGPRGPWRRCSSSKYLLDTSSSSRLARAHDGSAG